MAPPSNKPKLSAIVPEVLALDIANRFREHLQSQLFHVQGIGHVIPLDVTESQLRQSDLYMAVRTLAGYARGDHGLDASVQEYWISLIPLWSSTLGMADHEDISAHADPDTELGLVMAAAQAREDLTEGRAVTSAQLAMLASMSPRAVQDLVTRGELQAERLEGSSSKALFVSAKDAKRWLAARGVPGFARARAR